MERRSTFLPPSAGEIANDTGKWSPKALRRWLSLRSNVKIGVNSRDWSFLESLGERTSSGTPLFTGIKPSGSSSEGLSLVVRRLLASSDFASRPMRLWENVKLGARPSPRSGEKIGWLAVCGSGNSTRGNSGMKMGCGSRSLLEGGSGRLSHGGSDGGSGKRTSGSSGQKMGGVSCCTSDAK